MPFDGNGHLIITGERVSLEEMLRGLEKPIEGQRLHNGDLIASQSYEVPARSGEPAMNIRVEHNAAENVAKYDPKAEIKTEEVLSIEAKSPKEAQAIKAKLEVAGYKGTVDGTTLTISGETHPGFSRTDIPKAVDALGGEAHKVAEKEQRLHVSGATETGRVTVTQSNIMSSNDRGVQADLGATESRSVTRIQEYQQPTLSPPTADGTQKATGKTATFVEIKPEAGRAGAEQVAQTLQAKGFTSHANNNRARIWYGIKLSDHTQSADAMRALQSTEFKAQSKSGVLTFASETDAQKAQAFLAEKGITGERSFRVIAPGSAAEVATALEGTHITPAAAESVKAAAVEIHTPDQQKAAELWRDKRPLQVATAGTQAQPQQQQQFHDERGAAAREAQANQQAGRTTTAPEPKPQGETMSTESANRTTPAQAEMDPRRAAMMRAQEAQRAQQDAQRAAMQQRQAQFGGGTPAAPSAPAPEVVAPSPAPAPEPVQTAKTQPAPTPAEKPVATPTPHAPESVARPNFAVAGNEIAQQAVTANAAHLDANLRTAAVHGEHATSEGERASGKKTLKEHAQGKVGAALAIGGVAYGIAHSGAASAATLGEAAADAGVAVATAVVPFADTAQMLYEGKSRPDEIFLSAMGNIVKPVGIATAVVGGVIVATSQEGVATETAAQAMADRTTAANAITAKLAADSKAVIDGASEKSGQFYDHIEALAHHNPENTNLQALLALKQDADRAQAAVQHTSDASIGVDRRALGKRSGGCITRQLYQSGRCRRCCAKHHPRVRWHEHRWSPRRNETSIARPRATRSHRPPTSRSCGLHPSGTADSTDSSCPIRARA